MSNGCPLCYSERHTIKYRDVLSHYKIDIVQCTNCKHFFSLYKEQLPVEQLYSSENYEIVETRDTIFDKIMNLEYNKVLHLLDKFYQDNRSLIDFGAGKGKFGSLAKRDGWQVKCVETSKERALYAAKVYGLEVNEELYSTGSIFEMKFDVLTLFHVLEHLPEPKMLLNELMYHNLEPDAIVVIEVPNFNSLQSRISGSKWLHLDASRHISHFTPERLRSLTNELSLSPVKETYFSLHLGVLGMLDSLLKFFGYKKNIIYELKNKRTFLLILKVMVLLPFAFLLEIIALPFKSGGVIRLYLKRRN